MVSYYEVKRMVDLDRCITVLESRLAGADVLGDSPIMIRKSEAMTILAILKRQKQATDFIKKGKNNGRIHRS